MRASPPPQLPAKVTLSGAAFAEAEARGKLPRPLSAREREKIQRLLAEYVWARRPGYAQFVKSSREQLRKFENLLGKVVRLAGNEEIIRMALGAFLEDLGEGGNETIEVLARRELDGLEALRLSIVDFEKRMALSPHRQRDIALAKLLFQLEAIYLQAGGKHTGVWRSRSRHRPEQRQSVYIEFAFTLISQLPHHRDLPGSFSALVSRWDELWQDRNRGGVPRRKKVRAGEPA